MFFFSFTYHYPACLWPLIIRAQKNRPWIWSKPDSSGRSSILRTLFSTFWQKSGTRSRARPPLSCLCPATTIRWSEYFSSTQDEGEKNSLKHRLFCYCPTKFILALTIKITILEYYFHRCNANFSIENMPFTTQHLQSMRWVFWSYLWNVKRQLNDWIFWIFWLQVHRSQPSSVRALATSFNQFQFELVGIEIHSGLTSL